MCHLQSFSRRMVIACAMLAWTFVGGEASAQGKVAPKEKIERGWFDSFKDGKLELKSQRSSASIHIPESAKTFVWNHSEDRYQPVETAEAMRQLKTLTVPVDPQQADSAEGILWRKAGTGLAVHIGEETVTIRIGEKKSPFIGKFVSFKDDVLAFRNTDPTGPYRKSYGNTLNFKMREDIAVYESIDGGDYKWIGTPRTAFGNVKEGANIAVYHHYKTEDDEFYLVLIGVSKKK